MLKLYVPVKNDSVSLLLIGFLFDPLIHWILICYWCVLISSWFFFFFVNWHFFYNIASSLGGSTPTITTTGYLTKSCRGTPQTHEIGNAGCTNGKDNKGSTLTECVIPEVYEPSSSNLACCKTCPDETRVPCAGSTMYLNQIVAVISIVLIALQIL